MDNLNRISESYGTTYHRFYTIDYLKNKLEKREKNLNYGSIKNFVLSVFLPHGYPESVSDDYLQYQIWDSFQAFASSITGSIATHAVLRGVGVGDENATPIAATITWLLKDGVSMVGRISFAWLQGTSLDNECKKWRLFADVLNDIAMLFDLLSGYFKHYFIFIICLSGLMKSLVGVAGGCTRAALTQHQARKNNMADVSAKDGSQETLVNLVALLCSLFLLPIVTESVMLTWTVYVVMTFIHLGANYLAVKSVVMETFNEARFKIYTMHYLKWTDYLSIAEVNESENLFFSQCFGNVEVKFGSSFTDIISGRSCSQIKGLLAVYKRCNYLLRVNISSKKTVIFIAFNSKANVLTKMEAFFQACIISNNKSQYWPEGSQAFSKMKDKDLEVYLEIESRNYTMESFRHFKESLELMKFNLEAVLLNIDLWRVNWS